jgi:Flp pilus assembly protein TadB
MKPTPPTQRPDLTIGEMLGEVIDLSVGVGIALLPMLLLSMPGIILFVVLPALLLLALAAPVLVIGAAITVPYLVVRRWRRRRPALPAMRTPLEAPTGIEPV